MSIVSLNTIKNWFKTGLKPTQVQFWSTWDSYWHKDEKIPITNIYDIENILNDKADAEALTNHLTDANAHAALFEKCKIYPVGKLQIFKLLGNLNDEILESGDWCIGFVEGQFINANYLAGDRNLLASFDI